MNLVHVIVRQWRQRPARTVLSILSVAIAVAAVFGVALAQAGVRLSYRKLLQVVEGRPALEILSASGGRFDASIVPQLGDLSGLYAQIPVVTRATMARVHGRRFRGVLLGVPVDTPQVWEALLLVEGRPCRAANEAVLSAELAASLKIKLGDRVTVLTRRGPRSASVTGLVEPAALREFAPAATLAMPLEAVQEFFSLEHQVDRVRLLVASRDVRPRLRQAVAAVLPASLVVQSPVEQAELADSILRSTELALRFAGALTMAMAAFIILNTLRMNFGERRRDVAVLRVLGVTQRQVVGLHLLEGACLGFVGSLAGIPLGLALGRALETVMQRLVSGNATSLPLSYWTLPTALVVGPLVACVAALVPALQSRRVSASEAFGGSEARRGERFPLWALVLGVVMWTAAAVLLVAVVLERLSPEAAIPSGVLMLVGFLTIIPVLLSPVVRVAERVLAPWMRVEGSFAAEELLARPTRTGLTVGVLVAALSTSLGLGNAILNNVDDVRAWYRRTMSGDVFLLGGAVEGGLATDERNVLRDAIAARRDVARVVEIRYLPTRVAGFPAGCVVRDFPDDVELPWVVAEEDVARIRARLRAGDAVVGSVLARKLGLVEGDALRFELQGRVLSLRVGALVRDYALGGMVVFVDHAAAEKLIALGPADIYIVRPQPGTPLEPLVESLRPLAAEHGLSVRSFTELRRQLDGLIDGIVFALWGLVGVGFVIGGVAVANTLTMSVLEQTRELGLLRIVGMTRRQVRKLVFGESLLLGILGTLLGTLAGVTTALVIHLCNEPLLGQSVPFAFHAWLLAVNVGTCLAVAIVAAWAPGRRAARLNLLSAIAYE